MKQDILTLREEALAAVQAAESSATLEETRVRILGRKGVLTQMLRGLGQVSPEERREWGALANEFKDAFTQALEQRALTLSNEDMARRLAAEGLDITLPGRDADLGGVHPITRALGEIGAVFASMGFEVASGPEVEDDWHNFEALNIPPDHPAREMHDTFYLADAPDGRRRVLRTHTSPVQIRVMEGRPPPLAVIAPGRVYRCDSDLTHTPMFHQVEGFMVDQGLHFGHLKGLLASFLEAFFQRPLPVRFRPSFFPFTEPSAEGDMGCLFCEGRGCRVCKGTGWLEILGCGMIHPQVLAHVGIDRERYSGFAFGVGVERMAMLKYRIGDLRTFFDNDVRFLARHARV
ncbi:MAG: phenylalanine--tRNA ligase subunit alpha [Magnetococcus sp. WYHC-3]